MDAGLLAARGYDTARPFTAPDKTGPRTAVGRAAESFVETLARAEAAAEAQLSGHGDPHALVAALTEAQLAVETVVAVRDRVVEAYLEILRMPV